VRARGTAITGLPPDFEENLTALGGFAQPLRVFGAGHGLVVDFNDDLVKGACMCHQGALSERLQ